MINHRLRNLFLSALLLFLFPALAFADIVQGQIAQINSNALQLTVFDGQGRPYPNALYLKTDSRTKYNGVSSAATLKRGDKISADVRQEETGLWRADTINKYEEMTAVQPGPPPSPSLIDALKSPGGQKVIRNGLTGAVTGAVAAGASGGKAGKGALIGAGAGILGGFISDLLSGRPQSQSSAAVTNQEEQKR